MILKKEQNLKIGSWFQDRMQEIRMDANSDDDNCEGFDFPAITAAEERNRVHVFV